MIPTRAPSANPRGEIGVCRVERPLTRRIERTTAMILAPDRTQLAEDLRRMMDELCAPELTLARANVLRPRVQRLLEVIRETDSRPRADRLEAGLAGRN